MMKDINIDVKASYDILDKFVELGGNFIDTADVYSHGESEEIIGEWMKEWVITANICCVWDYSEDKSVVSKEHLPAM